MPQGLQIYTSQHSPGPAYRQARRVWAVTVAVTVAWILLIVAPPLLHSSYANGLADNIFGFFGYICHQIPDRSFQLLGNQVAVCSRCFGVYFGLAAGIAAYPLWRRIDDIEPLPRLWLFASMVPIGIDWSLTIFGIWENTHLSRFVTGAILGFACATYILPALVEIIRLRSSAHDRPLRSDGTG